MVEEDFIGPTGLCVQYTLLTIFAPVSFLFFPEHILSSICILKGTSPALFGNTNRLDEVTASRELPGRQERVARTSWAGLARGGNVSKAPEMRALGWAALDRIESWPRDANKILSGPRTNRCHLVGL
jgi:hypothetical protein